MSRVTRAAISFEEMVRRADALFKGEFYFCPVTGRVLDSGDPHDDKVICNCRAARNSGSTHSKRGLRRATAEEYVRQHEGALVALGAVKANR